MRTIDVNIVLIFILLFNFFLSIGTVRSGGLEADVFSNKHIHEGTPGILSDRTTTDSSIELIQPPDKSQITTVTPTFIWQAIKSESPVEYRLLIAKPDGRVIFDQWIGGDTSFTVPASKSFEDLNPYYWTIYAFYNNQQIQSLVWSFWIDQNVVTDLAVTNISLVDEKKDWESGDQIKIKATLENSGPIDAEQCVVTLYSGNFNRNYWDYSAYRKTIALDTVIIPMLKINDPQSVILTAKLPYGFNHFSVRIDPIDRMKDVIDVNNSMQGIKIQTENRVLSLNSLFIIYKNYIDRVVGKKRLDHHDLNQIHQNISKFQQYFWDHTLILQINVDTFYVDRALSIDDFTYHDNHWGYFLSPEEVKIDLKHRDIEDLDYDFIFVYYSWWNSALSWSGYSGYTFKNYEFFNKKVSFLAQPAIPGQVGDENIIVHEFFHFLGYLFEKSGDRSFYSPHHRTLYTTFEDDKDYFDWILETWQTDKWFHLKIGHILPREQPDREFKASPSSLSPTTLILSQNYPNPFNKITTIIYKIPSVANSSEGIKAKLTIYDIMGNLVRVLIDEIHPPGTYRVYWDGKNQKANQVASGIYFYELRAGKQREVKKLLYIR